MAAAPGNSNSSTPTASSKQEPEKGTQELAFLFSTKLFWRGGTKCWEKKERLRATTLGPGGWCFTNQSLYNFFVPVGGWFFSQSNKVGSLFFFRSPTSRSPFPCLWQLIIAHHKGEEITKADASFQGGSPTKLVFVSPPPTLRRGGVEHWEGRPVARKLYAALLALQRS